MPNVESLLEAARTGHPGALDQLLRLCQPDIRRYARRNCMASDVDDAVRIELVQALESMPIHYREIILLRDLEELTIGEMASSLSLSTAAVKSRLHRARLLMREYLLED